MSAEFRTYPRRGDMGRPRLPASARINRTSVVLTAAAHDMIGCSRKVHVHVSDDAVAFSPTTDDDGYSVYNRGIGCSAVITRHLMPLVGQLVAVTQNDQGWVVIAKAKALS